MTGFTTLDELRDAMDAAASATDIGLGMDSCPCFVLEVPGFMAVGHCWRTWWTDPRGGNCKHIYSGLHYWGDPVIAKRLRFLLNEMHWGGKWPMRCEGTFEQRPTEP